MGSARPMRKVESRGRPNVPARLSLTAGTVNPSQTMLNESAFSSMLYMERRRAERAEKRFVLVLIDVEKPLSQGLNTSKFVAALSAVTRETDILGWYLEDSLVGVIGTELGMATNQAIEQQFVAKVRRVFEQTQGRENAEAALSFHFFPEKYEQGENQDHSVNIALYPELQKQESTRRVPFAIKRCIDILGSMLALLLLAPIFAAIAIAIKLYSKGPVIFKQERLGQYGKPFTLLKFRSMRMDCDAQIHQQYVREFITGKAEGKSEDVNGDVAKVFKIQKDPRVTPIGRFIRKTSLDELPQFWNVLRGDMSLVGPRPPVAYEFRAYDVWHRRRVLEIKPGITGLWQVEGRSRTRFDDMVRLDLRYARAWSIWLDLKILLATPRAVLGGDGAY